MKKMFKCITSIALSLCVMLSITVFAADFFGTDTGNPGTNGSVDAKDAAPYQKNGEMNYIFYEDNDDMAFLRNEAFHREKLLKEQGKEVTLLVAANTEDFINKWNQLGLDDSGEEKYTISNVYIIYHGSRDHIVIKSANESQKAEANGKAENLLLEDIAKLDDKEIAVLNLCSCAGGNLDFINEWSYFDEETQEYKKYEQNIALRIMKECPSIKTVKAWDSPAYYIPIGSGIEFDQPVETTQKWSIKRNGKKRNTSGLITYTRNFDGSISCAPAFKPLYEFGVFPKKEDITEKIS